MIYKLFLRRRSLLRNPNKVLSASGAVEYHHFVEWQKRKGGGTLEFDLSIRSDFVTKTGRFFKISPGGRWRVIPESPRQGVWEGVATAKSCGSCGYVFATRPEGEPSQALRGRISTTSQARSTPASSFSPVFQAHAIRGVLCAIPICPWAFSTIIPPWPFSRCAR